ncbi:MBL fold metallo-hydrolase [Microbacterium dextranolyticum]|nr:MBL fold metallo-hydrolase [Microbacterium dextranolyticum]MBM7462731.1 L-ascorbate metabolism protein UlaG (beta-lactamase superfamily) [Microbacterium dextranolyticum]
MRITKHEHACLRLELEGRTMIIDPGGFTLPLDDLHGLVAVVITHEHGDHWTPEHLTRLRAAARDVPVYATAGVAAAGADVIVVSPGDTVTAGPFTVTFHGGTHNVIHESIPVVENVGVLVNDVFYYPGDSYQLPRHTDIRLLAAPVGAPWLKIGEAMDFVLAAKPHRAFATHDMTLSRIGLDMHRARLAWATEQNGGEFVALEPGESVEV